MHELHMSALATDFDTHPPHKWAEVLLDWLVPTVPECSDLGRIKIAEAKHRLRDHVIALVTELRNSERKAYLDFNEDDKHTIAATYRHYHGVERDNGLHFHTLHKDVKGKVRSSSDWADQCVNNICRIASEIDGNVGSNSMIDETWRIIDNFINTVQLCERSHYVTSNNLHQGVN